MLCSATHSSGGTVLVRILQHHAVRQWGATGAIELHDATKGFYNRFGFQIVDDIHMRWTTNMPIS
jgi:hypothetical protein